MDAVEILGDSRQSEVIVKGSFAEQQRHVLKHGDCFGVFDGHGDIGPGGSGELGLYHRDVRHLSRLEFRLGDVRPVPLNATVRRDNTLLVADLTNPDFTTDEGTCIPHGAIHIFRAKLLWEDVLYEHVRLHNYGEKAVELTLEFQFGADFRDMFEIRGKDRTSRGELLPAEALQDGFDFSYCGLDGVLRQTTCRVDPMPDARSADTVRRRLHLDLGEEDEIYLTVSCAHDDQTPPLHGYTEASRRQREDAQALRQKECRVLTSNQQFNAWIERSTADLNLLVTETETGLYPYAGIPWFNTFFGRDGILTALMTLWVNPDIALGVLRYLSETQATQEDRAHDAEPGKIVHEVRQSEMSMTGEVPFSRYYGTVDATPLFVVLAGAYVAHTGDLETGAELWPAVERALQWIDDHGDCDGDGFVEYDHHASGGLIHQGWKDADNAVFHEDGSDVEGPIALCEVQGYVYESFLQAASLAEALERTETSSDLRARASTLRARFEEAFWLEDLSCYALALDGEKNPCRIRSSNAGQVLFSGLPSKERSARLARILFEPDLFSGWGIRTVSTASARYNPLAYHNGSVWPHDNGMIGLGLGRHGHKQQLHRLVDAFLDASTFMRIHRLPELFCGFPRRSEEGPTPYPVACAPQAWAAATVFAYLQACLGLSVRGRRRQVVFRRPSLPRSIDEIRLNGLPAADATVDLRLRRYRHSVSVEVERREGDVEVLTVS